MGSPSPGCSTLMTSAPNSARYVPIRGPATRVAASMTVMPSSAGVAGVPPFGAGWERIAGPPRGPGCVPTRLHGLFDAVPAADLHQRRVRLGSGVEHVDLVEDRLRDVPGDEDLGQLPV